MVYVPIYKDTWRVLPASHTSLAISASHESYILHVYERAILTEKRVSTETNHSPWLTEDSNGIASIFTCNIDSRAA